MSDPHRFDDLFLEFGPIRLRRFFGGEGIYAGDVMIGMVFNADTIYFKTDAESRKAFDAEGSKPFTFTKGKELITTTWLSLPDRLYDEPEELARWARAARDVARAIPAEKEEEESMNRILLAVVIAMSATAIAVAAPRGLPAPERTCPSYEAPADDELRKLPFLHEEDLEPLAAADTRREVYRYMFYGCGEVMDGESVRVEMRPDGQAELTVRKTGSFPTANPPRLVVDKSRILTPEEFGRFKTLLDASAFWDSPLLPPPPCANLVVQVLEGVRAGRHHRAIYACNRDDVPQQFLSYVAELMQSLGG